MNLDFIKDEILRSYCLRMVGEMVLLFEISEEEALVRVAHFVETSKDSSGVQILHRSVQYWAEGIYFRFDEAGDMTSEPKPLPPPRAL